MTEPQPAGADPVEVPDQLKKIVTGKTPEKKPEQQPPTPEAPEPAKPEKPAKKRGKEPCQHCGAMYPVGEKLKSHERYCRKKKAKPEKPAEPEVYNQPAPPAAPAAPEKKDPLPPKSTSKPQSTASPSASVSAPSRTTSQKPKNEDDGNLFSAGNLFLIGGLFLAIVAFIGLFRMKPEQPQPVAPVVVSQLTPQQPAGHQQPAAAEPDGINMNAQVGGPEDPLLSALPNVVRNPDAWISRR